MDTPGRPFYKAISILLLLIGAILLPACSGVATPRPVYMPPASDEQNRMDATLIVPTLQTLIIPEPPISTPVLECTDNLLYLDDLSIPDDSILPAGASMIKQWQVENSGTCNWDARYRLRLVSGNLPGAEAELQLYPARSGTLAELSISITTPEDAGAYQAVWQAYDPANSPFGDPITIQFVVEP